MLPRLSLHVILGAYSENRDILVLAGETRSSTKISRVKIERTVILTLDTDLMGQKNLREKENQNLRHNTVFYVSSA